MERGRDVLYVCLMSRDIEPRRRVSKLVAALLVLFGPSSLSACSLDCHFDKTPFEGKAASQFNENLNRFDPPPDTWTPNKHLEVFIHGTVEGEGVEALKTRYGMQCLPRSGEPNCKDCLTCTTTFRDWRLDTLPIYIEWYKCVDFGEVLVNVDVGPGTTVKAMTYWKTSPAARDALSRGWQ